MNKKEMAEAMLAGKTLINDAGDIAFFDQEYLIPFVVKRPDGDVFLLSFQWLISDWKIKEEPKMRYMTHDEVQTFILYHPHILIRDIDDSDEKWNFPQYTGYIYRPECFEYIEVAEDGTRSEPKRFMVEDK